MRTMTIDRYMSEQGVARSKLHKSFSVSHVTMLRARAEGARVEIGNDGIARLYRVKKQYYGRNV
jgi:hypothetical protein